MRGVFGAAVLALGSILGVEPCIPCETALNHLIEGNKRYVENRMKYPDRSKDKSLSLLKKQEPFAVVVCCSDSRVSPEIVFDQDIGNIFVVRVAGNVIGPIELASIEFAVLQLGSSVIFVVGHQDCGAVKAVVAGDTEDIKPIASLIDPAVKLAKKEKGDVLENAIKINAKRARDQIISVKRINQLVEQNKLRVLAGYYTISTGHIQILP